MRNIRVRLLSVGLVATASLVVAATAGAEHGKSAPDAQDSVSASLTGVAGTCLFPNGASVTVDPPAADPQTVRVDPVCGAELTVSWEGSRGTESVPINDPVTCGDGTTGRRIGVQRGHGGYLDVSVVFDLNPAAAGGEHVLLEDEEIGPTTPSKAVTATLCGGVDF